VTQFLTRDALRVNNGLMSFLEAVRDEFSEDARWVLYFALGAFGVASLFALHVGLELAKVRPMLVFVMIQGGPPPICGFDVLFG